MGLFCTKHTKMVGNYKIISLLLLSGFYILAGVNHFINPDFYLPLIPSYLPFPEIINYVSGGLEILLGLLLLVPGYKRMAAWGIIFLLILFVPSHVYFIMIDSCITDGLCVPNWIGWLRLILIHPLLILWAWWHTRDGYSKN